MIRSDQTKKIVIISQGCAANFGDGEKLARSIVSAAEMRGEAVPEINFKFPETVPDEFYLNICTVKGNSGALKLLRRASETYPSVPVFITGCAPEDFKQEATMICPQVIFLPSQRSSNSSQTLRENPYIGIVNIEDGCLDACAFCSTHLVKGRLHSYPTELIVDQVQSLVNDGCKEIQLTGQDCGCYGFDIHSNLAELVQKILTHVSGNYRMRLGMGNPRHVKDYKEQLLDCFTDPRVYRFLHIPVQSGSESVLKLMKRQHTVQDYISLAQDLQQRYPLFTLSTDIIVGFPGETEQDFEATLEAVKITRPTVCNITRFVPRPGTVAAKLENEIGVPDEVKHERSAILAELFQQIALENNKQWIGSEDVISIEKNGYREGTVIGRNSAYRPVAIQGCLPQGKSLKVRIEDAEAFALIGKTIS